MELFLMTLSIKNGDYIKHLIKLVLYENDVKLLKFKRRPVDIDLWYAWSVRFELLSPERKHQEKRWNG